MSGKRYSEEFKIETPPILRNDGADILFPD